MNELKSKLRVKYHLHTEQKHVPTDSSRLEYLERFAKPGDMITMNFVLCKGRVD